MNNKTKKSLIGVYKRCITVLNRMHKLPIKEACKGSNTNIVAKKDYNYLNEVKRKISELQAA